MIDFDTEKFRHSFKLWHSFHFSQGKNLVVVASLSASQSVAADYSELFTLKTIQDELRKFFILSEPEKGELHEHVDGLRSSQRHEISADRKDLNRCRIFHFGFGKFVLVTHSNNINADLLKLIAIARDNNRRFLIGYSSCSSSTPSVAFGTSISAWLAARRINSEAPVDHASLLDCESLRKYFHPGNKFLYLNYQKKVCATDFLAQIRSNRDAEGNRFPECLRYEALARLEICGQPIPPESPGGTEFGFLRSIRAHGLQADFDQWLLEKVAIEFKVAEKLGEVWHISINIFASALTKRFDEMIKAIIDKKYRNYLEIEILEHEELDVGEGSGALTLIAGLITEGFSFSIDDFGRGYSNLNLLGKISNFQIKIDKSFIMDTHLDCIESANNIIVHKSIAELANHFGHEIVFEGINDVAVGKKIIELMKDMEIPLGKVWLQGFAIHKPSPLPPPPMKASNGVTH